MTRLIKIIKFKAMQAAALTSTMPSTTSTSAVPPTNTTTANANIDDPIVAAPELLRRRESRAARRASVSMSEACLPPIPVIDQSLNTQKQVK